MPGATSAYCGHTVTVHEAVSWVPSVVVAVMVAVPAARAVTLPFWSTVATVGSLDCQSRVLTTTSPGTMVAWSVCELPANRVMSVTFRVRLVMPVTFTSQVAMRLVPSVVLATIRAVPNACAVTLPFWSTLATDRLLDCQMSPLL